MRKWYEPPLFEPTSDYDILIKKCGSAKVQYKNTVKGYTINRIFDILERDKEVNESSKDAPNTKPKMHKLLRDRSLL